MNPVLYVDIDGVMADSIPWWIALHNKATNSRYTRADIKKWGDADFLTPYFKNYEYVLPVENSLESIGKLKNLYTIKFATSGHGVSWLQNLLKFEASDFEYIQIKSKHLLKGFAIIDDNAETVWRFDGIGMLLKQPWNMGKTWYEITEELIHARKSITD